MPDQGAMNPKIMALDQLHVGLGDVDRLLAR